MAQRQRAIEAPFLEEAAGEDHRVNDQGEHGPRQRETQRDAGNRARQQQAIRIFTPAGDGHETAPREQSPLDHEQRQRQRQQDNRQRRRSPRVLLHADNREIDRNRKHFEVAAEQERVAEIRKTFYEYDQERVRQTRRHQRQRDRCEGPQA